MVYIDKGTPRDCGMSRRGGNGPEAAVAVLREWLAQYRPEMVICQNPDAPGGKGRHAIDILLALTRALEDAEPQEIFVNRRQRHANIYQEAKALADHFPAFPKAPPEQPPIWRAEPRDMVYFEALALAHEVLR
ncbi:hypothetical protein FLO80_21145 [Aquicoccus porphyridii]|uniref:Uncharacterized protein n=1 Tax=Aquicoccus porphyridii TaxID=1852029 RepID=A0A5A9YXB5_9RHOB|nr:hypothetical protein [Aquicoccus porphyridii]KAA0909538.1 hypothetical protein FLO80_21145 [Aquicoccus porphyridii]RAI51815.1 hypothetical protein DOO74_21250 [Rhodobacteraceae bacterium AsT-22]